MFRDNSLVPSEAIRLAALGLLAEESRHYGDLAAELRHLTSRIVGPSLDLMGTSLEVLRYEGLIEAVSGKGMADNALLRITPQGRAALATLLGAALRTPINDLARLALLLKLRFLHHLPRAEQCEQLAMISESCEAELARLNELRAREAGRPGPFRDWLDQDIAQLEARLAWLAGQQAACRQEVRDALQ